MKKHLRAWICILLFPLMIVAWLYCLIVDFVDEEFTEEP